MPKIEPYTTSWGTQISQPRLRDLVESIAAGDDWQHSITTHLRDPIPVHEDDLDEAMEAYNHAESLQ